MTKPRAIGRLSALARKCRELGVRSCRVRYPDGLELEIELGDEPAKAAPKLKVHSSTPTRVRPRDRAQKDKNDALAKKRRVFGASGFAPE